MNASTKSKHDRFQELAESRTNKALLALARVANLANEARYEWDEREVQMMNKALKDAVAEIEKRFAAPKGKSGASFRFNTNA